MVKKFEMWEIENLQIYSPAKKLNFLVLLVQISWKILSRIIGIHLRQVMTEDAYRDWCV